MDELRLRPYQLRDAEKIVTWCADEKAFYKWSAGILGQYPLTAERFNMTMANRDNGRVSDYPIGENVWKCVDLELEAEDNDH